MSVKAISAPSDANLRAIALPIPLDAPVIRATFPVNNPIVLVLKHAAARAHNIVYLSAAIAASTSSGAIGNLSEPSRLAPSSVTRTSSSRRMPPKS